MVIEDIFFLVLLAAILIVYFINKRINKKRSDLEKLQYYNEIQKRKYKSQNYEDRN